MIDLEKINLNLILKGDISDIVKELDQEGFIEYTNTVNQIEDYNKLSNMYESIDKALASKLRLQLHKFDDDFYVIAKNIYLKQVGLEGYYRSHDGSDCHFENRKYPFYFNIEYSHFLTSKNKLIFDCYYEDEDEELEILNYYFED